MKDMINQINCFLSNEKKPEIEIKINNLDTLGLLKIYLYKLNLKENIDFYIRDSYIEVFPGGFKKIHKLTLLKKEIAI